MNDTTLERVDVSCVVSGETMSTRRLQDGSPALPRGWKRLGERYYSASAWHQQFSLRTVRFPIVSIECPVNSPDSHSAAWDLLRAALKLSWRQATQLSNWILTELAKADTLPLEVSTNGPKLPRIDDLAGLMRRIYQEGRQRWPELDSQSFCSIRHRVLAKYKQVRFDLRCRSAVSLPTYRYPTPLPIPAKDTLFTLKDGIAVLQVRISGQRFSLRLKGGRDFRRPLQAIKGVLAGDLLQGEVCLYEQIVGGAHHAGGKNPAVGRPTRLMAAIAVWLPNATPAATDRCCRVTTGSSRLWQVLLDGSDEPWYLNEDQIPRWTAAYHRQLQRLREDCKLDRRTRSADDLARRRAELRNKFANRITDACHKAAAMLVGFCRRNHVGLVEYDDTDKSWLPEFPWYQLRQLCADKCVAAGITFNRRE
jgi:hypothetical protein